MFAPGVVALRRKGKLSGYRWRGRDSSLKTPLMLTRTRPLAAT